MPSEISSSSRESLLPTSQVEQAKDWLDTWIQDTLPYPDLQRLISESSKNWDENSKKELLLGLQENEDYFWVSAGSPDALKTRVISILNELVRKGVKLIDADRNLIDANSTDIKINRQASANQLFETARARVDALYSLFWGQQAFEDKYAKELQQWRGDAITALNIPESDYQKLSSEDRTRIDSYVMLQNSEYLQSKLEPENQTKFANLIKDLQVAANGIGVPFPSTPKDDPWVTKWKRKEVADLLGVTESTRLIHQDSLLIAEKLGDDGKKLRIAVDISKYPPERVVLGEGSLRAASMKESFDSEKYSNRLQEINAHKDQLTSSFNANRAVSASRAINAIFPWLEQMGMEAKIADPSSIETYAKKFDFVSSEKLAFEQLNGIGKEDREILEKAIQTIRQSIQEMLTASQEFVKLSQEQEDIEREQRTNQEQSAQRLEKRDKNAQTNLAFFSSLGFSSLGQEKLEDFAKFFNQSNSRPSDLDTKTFTLKTKSEGLAKMNGEYGEAIDSDGKKRAILEILLSALPNDPSILGIPEEHTPGNTQERDPQNGKKPLLTLANIVNTADWIPTSPLTLKIDTKAKQPNTTVLESLIRNLKTNHPEIANTLFKE